MSFTLILHQPIETSGCMEFPLFSFNAPVKVSEVLPDLDLKQTS